MLERELSTLTFANATVRIKPDGAAKFATFALGTTRALTLEFLRPTALDALALILSITELSARRALFLVTPLNARTAEAPETEFALVAAKVVGKERLARLADLPTTTAALKEFLTELLASANANRTTGPETDVINAPDPVTARTEEISRLRLAIHVPARDTGTEPLATNAV